MDSNKLSSGIILIGIGLIVLLDNLGIITLISLEAIFDLWPLIFIVFGIHIIFKKNWIVSTFTWILFFTILIGYSYYYGESTRHHRSMDVAQIQLEKQPETETAELDLDFGGAEVELFSTDSHLLEANYPQEFMKVANRYTNGEKNAIIEFNPKRRLNWFKENAFQYRIRLNESVQWDVDMDIGAVSGTLDFTNIKLKNLDMEVGAGDLSLIFGESTGNPNISIDAGASELALILKNDVGVKIEIDGLLDMTNLESLGWTKNGNLYQSPNYQEAKNKVMIDLDMGVGELKIIEE